MTEQLLREQVVAVCREMNRSGLNVGSSGNASVRCGEQMLITPSAARYESLQPESIPMMALGVDVPPVPAASLRPSSEWRMHHAILRARSDIDAVLHLHPAHATALACLRKGIPPFHYMVAVAGGPDIRCCPYAAFGSEELSAYVLEALQGRCACLMANHGIVTLGASLQNCLDLAEQVEHLAHQYLLACSTGEPVLLNEVEMDVVLEQFGAYQRGGLR